MTIYITGGQGYIGSHLTDWLNRRGEKIVVLDNNSGNNRFLQFPNVKYVNVSLEQNSAKEILLHEFKRSKGNFVIHLAGLKSVGASMANPELFNEINLTATKNVLDAMKESNMNRIMFASSAAVYGNSSRSVDEFSLTNPISNYGKVKLAEEEMILSANQEFIENIAILRFFNIIGAAESGLREKFGENIFPKMLQAINTNESFQIFGSNYETSDGTCERDYLDVRDLCRAISEIIRKFESKSIGIVNLGSGSATSVFQLVNSVRAVQDLKYKFEEKREGDIPTLVANIERVKELVQWSPKYSLEESILSSFSD